jgi:hypothetical protein
MLIMLSNISLMDAVLRAGEIKLLWVAVLGKRLV